MEGAVLVVVLCARHFIRIPVSLLSFNLILYIFISTLLFYTIYFILINFECKTSLFSKLLSHLRTQILWYPYYMRP